MYTGVGEYFIVFYKRMTFIHNPPFIGLSQGSKCPSLPGLTHWVNPGLPGLGFKPSFGKVGNTGE